MSDVRIILGNNVNISVCKTAHAQTGYEYVEKQRPNGLCSMPPRRPIRMINFLSEWTHNRDCVCACVCAYQRMHGCTCVRAFMYRVTCYVAESKSMQYVCAVC